MSLIEVDRIIYTAQHNESLSEQELKHYKRLRKSLLKRSSKHKNNKRNKWN